MRALIWLAAMQKPDGTFPQNSWINGTAYWTNLQLDELAAPILLAWRLRREGGTLGLFDPAHRGITPLNRVHLTAYPIDGPANRFITDHRRRLS